MGRKNNKHRQPNPQQRQGHQQRDRRTGNPVGEAGNDDGRPLNRAQRRRARRAQEREQWASTMRTPRLPADDVVLPAQQKKKQKKWWMGGKATPEQIHAIALDTIGATYYCVGTPLPSEGSSPDPDDESSPPWATTQAV